MDFIFRQRDNTSHKERSSNDTVSLPLDLPTGTLQIDPDNLPKFSLEQSTNFSASTISKPKAFKPPTGQEQSAKQNLVKNKPYNFADPIKLQLDNKQSINNLLSFSSTKFTFDNPEKNVTDSSVDASMKTNNPVVANPSTRCYKCYTNNEESVANCACGTVIKLSKENSAVISNQCISCHVAPKQANSEKCGTCEPMQANLPLSSLILNKSKKWTCDGCYVENDLETIKCPCCGTAKPSKDITNNKETPCAVDKTHELGTNASISVTNTNKWNCTNCWVMNDNDKDKCVCCYNPKETSNIVSKGDSEKNWKCESCYKENSSESDTCTICRYTKASVKSTPFGASSSKSTKSATLVNNKTDIWNCTSCKSNNDRNRSRCFCCDTPKLLQDLLDGNVSEALASASKFNFGIPLQKEVAKTEVKPTEELKKNAEHSETNNNILPKDSYFSFGIASQKGAVDEVKENKVEMNTPKFSFGIPSNTSLITSVTSSVTTSATPASTFTAKITSSTSSPVTTLNLPSTVAAAVVAPVSANVSASISAPVVASVATPVPVQREENATSSSLWTNASKVVASDSFTIETTSSGLFTPKSSDLVTTLPETFAPVNPTPSVYSTEITKTTQPGGTVTLERSAFVIPTPPTQAPVLVEKEKPQQVPDIATAVSKERLTSSHNIFGSQIFTFNGTNTSATSLPAADKELAGNLNTSPPTVNITAETSVRNNIPSFTFPSSSTMQQTNLFSSTQNTQNILEANKNTSSTFMMTNNVPRAEIAPRPFTSTPIFSFGNNAQNNAPETKQNFNFTFTAANNSAGFTPSFADSLRNNPSTSAFSTPPNTNTNLFVPNNPESNTNTLDQQPQSHQTFNFGSTLPSFNRGILQPGPSQPNMFNMTPQSGSQQAPLFNNAPQAGGNIRPYVFGTTTQAGLFPATNTSTPFGSPSQTIIPPTPGSFNFGNGTQNNGFNIGSPAPVRILVSYFF